MALDLKKYIASYKDFPQKGVLFRDISPLIENGKAFRQATNEIADYARSKNVDIVVGPEARGFIVGSPVSYALGVGFSPARKKGKLPGETVEASYGLEYGEAALYLRKGAVKPGQNVLIVDDLLATGGTINATVKLVEDLGANVVGTAFIIELSELKGRDKIEDHDVFSLLKY